MVPPFARQPTAIADRKRRFTTRWNIVGFIPRPFLAMYNQNTNGSPKRKALPGKKTAERA
jgi:hypothetical protein